MLSRVWLFATPWTAAHQDSLSITNSQSLPKLTSTESVIPSNHPILCRPLHLLPWIFPSIRVFSNESALLIRWPKFSFPIFASSKFATLRNSKSFPLSCHLSIKKFFFTKMLCKFKSQPSFWVIHHWVLCLCAIHLLLNLYFSLVNLLWVYFQSNFSTQPMNLR